MAQKIRIRRRPPGLAFYTTALVITLFAVYSQIRYVFYNPDRHQHTQLQSRSLTTQDLECRLVRKAPDQCAFVRSNCPDEEAGLISYLQLYYCSLPHAKAVAFTVLTVWMCLLFSTIGIAASDFLCINLSTIASILGMSETLAGVTFLAFGNGSSDVFSTFAAMSSNSGSLAVGELMGAAGFITAVVAGSMAIVKPFRVARKSFVRDISFFAVAASFSLVFLADGSLKLWECTAMVAFYIFYVVFVVFWHWWQTRTRRIRLSENAARLHMHIPDQQELEVPELEEDDEGQPIMERTPLLRESSDSNLPMILAPNTPVWKMEDAEDDDETRGRYLAELQSNMRVSRSVRGDRRNTITPIRPSLIGALEFRSVLQSLERQSTNSRPINLRRYSDDPGHRITQVADVESAASQPVVVSGGMQETNGRPSSVYPGGRGRAVSTNDANALRLSQDLLTATQATPETAIYSPQGEAVTNANRIPELHLERMAPGIYSPNLLLSPTTISDRSGGSSPASMHAIRNGLLAPPSTDAHRLDNHDDIPTSAQNSHLSPGGVSPLALSPMTAVPKLKIPTPNERSRSQHKRTDSAFSTASHSRAPSIRLPPPSMSPESSYRLPLLDQEEDSEPRIFKWWPYKYLPTPQMLAATLFPTLYGWSEKSLADKMLGIVTAPTVFLLTITVPVVELKAEEDDALPEGPMTPVTLSPTEIRSAATTRPTTNAGLSSGTSYNDNNMLHPQSALSRQQSNVPKIPEIQVQPMGSHKIWNRWLVILQVFTAPFFVLTIVWANLDEVPDMATFLKYLFASLIFSLLCLALLITTTSADREPKYRSLFCFLGFAVAIAWISSIANEVVGVLKAFGVILDISDAILGLTIFAVGNSLGDLVADITVAKLGYPVMALSACFGGPMLNILLGIGMGGMYMTIHNGTHRHQKHPDRPIKYKPYELDVSTTLMISGVTLLVTLLGLLIVVPLNSWRMDRKIGIGLIVLWSCSTVANVALEVMGVGGKLSTGSA